MTGVYIEEDMLAWSVLLRTPGLDASVLTQALAQLGSPAALVRASPAGLQKASIPARSCAYLSSREAQIRPAEHRWLEAPNRCLIPFTDPCYPALLGRFPDRPIALYVRGATGALNAPQVAMVGSRQPTHQGVETALMFAEGLARRGLAITSGMAAGIDASAHRGALRVQGLTLAVLGTGIDVVYPSCNADLHRDIATFGALASELPLGEPPRRANFPRRNRIIAGLSLGTLVIEAGHSSGSLITARRAAEYGRRVFAVPGSIQNPLSRGGHALIKDGATLVESASDILGELNLSSSRANDLALVEAPRQHARGAVGMDKDHKILLDALGFDPVDLDSLVYRTGLKPAAVSSMMLILELEGHVQAAPGGRYSRVAYRRAGGEG